jgi:hypothetical protein
MKQLFFSLLVMASFALTGCFDVTEELFLKKGGSGSYKITMDMSSIMDPSMQQMLKSAMNEQGADMDEDDPIEIDTMMYFKDMKPEVLADLERPEVFKNAFMHMDMSDSRETLIIEYGLDFEKIEDIDYFNKNMSKFTDDPMGGGLAASGGGFLPSAEKLFSLNKKNLTRNPAEQSDLGVSEEEMEMVMMMMGTAKYKTIYNFPGKVKKVTIEGAKIDGNKVIVQESLIDILKGEIDMSGDIKFKW